MRQTYLLVALTTLLCACTPPDIEMSVSQDARVLSGHWAGTLIDNTRLTVVGGADGRVYALNAVDDQFASGTTSEVMALGAGSGVLLYEAALKGVTSLAYRTDGVLLAATDSAVLELDPGSFAVLREHPVVGGVLSRDGTTVMTEDSRIETTTWTQHFLPRSATNVPDRFETANALGFSSDGAWKVDNAHYIVNPLTGVSVDAAPQHTLICNTTGYGTSAIAFDNEGAGLAIGYLDGTVEIRDAQGRLQRVLVVSDECIAGGVVAVSVFGNKMLVLAGMNGAQEKLIGIDINSGQTTRYAVALHQDGGVQWSSEPRLTNSGVAFSELFGIVTSPHLRALRFMATNGRQWSVDRATLPVSLDAQASFVSDAEYQTQGAITVDGRRINFQMQATVYPGHPNIVFKQGVPPAFVVYATALVDVQGSYGQLRGGHDSTRGQNLFVVRDSDGHELYGSLQRQ